MHIKEIQQKQTRHIKNMETDEPSPQTINKYKVIFNSFNNYLNTAEITTINNKTINDIISDYMAYLKDNNLCLNSRNQYYIIINKFLAKECKFKTDPKKLKRPKKRRPKYIIEKQYMEILKHLETQRHQAQTQKQIKLIDTDTTIIKLLYDTGLRIHEALKIKIDELTKTPKDHNNNYQLEIIGKGNKQRIIIITPATYKILMQYIQQYKKPGQIYIFESDKKPHTPITKRTIERHFKRIAKELDAIHGNNPKNEDSYNNLFKPHSLRRSYAVLNLADGVPINAMKQLLGHEDIKTTQIYTELTANSLSDAVTRANAQAI